VLDDGNHVLIRRGRLQGVELAVEKLRGKEVSVPGGEPLGEHLAIHGQEDQPRPGAPVQQDVPVGALQG